MDIDKLRTILTIVNAGSFSKAAEKTGYTQAGISYIANAVEEELGIKILERSYNGVRLTKDGEAVIGNIRRTVDAYSDLESSINARKKLKAVSLRIASIDSMSIKWLPQAAARFRKRYPEVHVDMIEGTPFEINDWVSEGTADFGLTEKAWASGEFIWRTLEEDPFFCIFPRGVQVPYPCTLKSFEGHDFFIPDFRRDENVPVMLRDAGVEVNYMYDRASSPSIIKRVATGTGTTLMSALAIDLCGLSHTEEASLPQIVPLDPYTFRELGAVYRKDRRHDMYITDFISDLRKVINEDTSWKAL